MIEKPHGRPVYRVTDETVEAGFIGSLVAQVCFWREENSEVLIGITSPVLALLLDECPTILGAPALDASGRTFWVRRMAVAASNGLRVGSIALDQPTISWRDADQPCRDWINERRDAQPGNYALDA